jgi:S-formylglutathione hydrolase FrmB
MNQIPPGWSTDEIASHPCEIFEPKQRNEHGFVVLYLHGVRLGRLAERPVCVAELEKHGLPVVCPITQRSWWTDRICPEFDPELTAERHLLDNVLPYIDRRYGSKPPQIALLGTSMGGQGALRMSYRHPKIFPVAAAISPAIDYYRWVAAGDPVLCQMYDNAEQARQDTATLHVHPLNWPRHQFFCCDPTDDEWFESSDRLRMKLYSIGILHDCDLETTGGGHGVAYYETMAPKAVGFIAERLERERLRVV